MKNWTADTAAGELEKWLDDNTWEIRGIFPQEEVSEISRSASGKGYLSMQERKHFSVSATARRVVNAITFAVY